MVVMVLTEAMEAMEAMGTVEVTVHHQKHRTTAVSLLVYSSNMHPANDLQNSQLTALPSPM